MKRKSDGAKSNGATEQLSDIWTERRSDGVTKRQSVKTTERISDGATKDKATEQ